VVWTPDDVEEAVRSVTSLIKFMATHPEQAESAQRAVRDILAALERQPERLRDQFWNQMARAIFGFSVEEADDDAE